MRKEGENGAGVPQVGDMLKVAAPHRATVLLVNVLLFAVFLIAEVATNRVVASRGMLSLGSRPLPVASFAGVVTSVANICLICMVLFCGRRGFYICLVVSAVRFAGMARVMVVERNFASMPGLFTGLVTLIAVLLIHWQNEKLGKYQERIRRQAVTDSLTGLPNRFACSEFVEGLIRRGERFSVVSIDLNNFKSINDTMGHLVGSEVLVEVAGRWNTAVETRLSGTQDFVARLSGDEFALVIRGYRTDDDVLKSIKYYQTVLENRITVDDCDFYITASFGYAEFPSDAKGGDTLFSRADTAMYEVKRTNNSNRILRFTSSILKLERTLEVERLIRDALENDTVFFQLQPQYDIDHKLRGFEALVRMKDSAGNIINPGEFIPVAEKVGLIDKVDGVVLRKATAFFGDLLRRSGADITLSVNASVRHLMKNDFLDELHAALADSGLPAGRLEVEITESIMIDSAEKALNCISEIKKMGVKIAIDDFGTGYSSLSYLNKFPANLLKVDKSFIDKMNTSDSSKQYVAAIISIGHIMGFDVIAEGIEEQSQLDTLREIGCDFIQGFYWGRPLPQDAAEKLVLELPAAS